MQRAEVGIANKECVFKTSNKILLIYVMYLLFTRWFTRLYLYYKFYIQIIPFELTNKQDEFLIRKGHH